MAVGGGHWFLARPGDGQEMFWEQLEAFVVAVDATTTGSSSAKQ